MTEPTAAARTDPARESEHNHGLTGFYVRAMGQDGKWGTFDIAELDRESLLAWLMQPRAADGLQVAVPVALSLLGHDHNVRMPDFSTDTMLLNGLQSATITGACPALIYDDNGFWAVADDGFQTIADSDQPRDVATSFFVKADQWRNSPREAIQAYLQRDLEGDKSEGDG